MPELPEVETIKNGLLQKVKNKKILQAKIYNNNLRWPIENNVIKKIEQQIIIDILRRGKYLIFKFISGDLIVHLGMSGVITVLLNDVPIKKHDHFEIIFSDNMRLRYNDQRRFGCILWCENYTKHQLIKNLGPEPLESEFNTQYLFRSIQKSKTHIKLSIMNSKIVVGVGNIYASEVLFLAKINPLTLSYKLPYQACNLLAQAIKIVLSKAIEYGGTSIKDYRASDGKPGYFQQELLVYGRDNQACKICNNNISIVRLGGRSTFFCANCQSC